MCVGSSSPPAFPTETSHDRFSLWADHLDPTSAESSARPCGFCLDVHSR